MSCEHYTHREYAGNRAGFGCAAIFLFIAFTSLAMKNAGIEIFGLYAWGYWLFIPAFFIIIGSISQAAMDRCIREDVANVIRFGGNRRYTIDEIAIEASVRRHCVPRVLMDLRDLGCITYTFDAGTGGIVASEQPIYQQPSMIQPAPRQNAPVMAQVVQKKYHYCMHCGQMLEDVPDSGKKYCPNCGSLVP